MTYASHSGRGPVHPSTDDARDLLGQARSSRPRRSQPDVTHVVVEIEVRVLDPVGAIQTQRHLHHLATQRFEMTDHHPGTARALR